MSTPKDRTRAPKLADDTVEVNEMLALIKDQHEALAKLVNAYTAGSYTIDEFCARHRLSRSQFYALQREDRGPHQMSIGSVGKRISREAEADWIRAREAEALNAARNTAA